MTVKILEFVPFDPRNAGDKEYQCESEFRNSIRHEELPDDPPIPLEEHIQGWKNIPAFVEVEVHVVWDETNSKIIAECSADIVHTGDNEHLAEVDIRVLPEYRRQGYAHKALELALRFAQKHNRKLLFFFSSERIPAGAIFMEKLGARKGMENRTNQLKVSEFDKSLVQTWLDKSDHLKDSFNLEFIDGPYPEDNINDIVDLYQEVANDQPRENLEMEDMNFTAKIIRDVEKNIFARGNQRWTYYLTDPTNGRVAGLTEVVWNPNRPMILEQGFTGVYPDYRSKGLGRWLKAEMMQKILHEHPEVEFIRTMNANSNAPMLKINVEMGFKPYIANTIWQVETEKVESYLKSIK